jgi:hypothetical protein
MKKLYSFKKTYLHFLIFFIVIALCFPIYHQHIDNYHPEPLTPADHVTPHPPNDYSVSSHETILERESLPEGSHHTHYHSHFEKDFYRTRRIDTDKVKTMSVYTFEAFNSLSINSLVLKKQSHDYYNPKYYCNNYAKTSSGLSPPRFSI